MWLDFGGQEAVQDVHQGGPNALNLSSSVMEDKLALRTARRNSIAILQLDCLMQLYLCCKGVLTPFTISKMTRLSNKQGKLCVFSYNFPMATMTFSPDRIYFLGNIPLAAHL